MFKSVKCTYAFYDDYCDQIFYCFKTTPSIGHGEWAISRDGGTAYDMRTDRITQSGFPEELIHLVEYIPSRIEVDGLPE